MSASTKNNTGPNATMNGTTVLNNLATFFGGGIVTMGELMVIESEVHDIIKSIDDHLNGVKPDHFKTHGYIAPTSFGGGSSAQNLALHHSRAHAVMTDTLKGVKADLQNFQDACRDAKKYLNDADLTSAGDLNAVRNAVSSISTGAQSNQGGADYTAAQYRHRDDGAGSDKGDA
ncbi:MAG: hypothetical protein FWE71_04270 [Nocardioidaceae bacterium]|nr:hypothetical protein [Nocardioidaceae bacterium]MCL2612979.1 hypothetical protein [Nocardioidaceae bacterium]